MQKAFLLVLALLTISAVCDVQEFQNFVTDNTDVTLQDQSIIDYVLVIDKSGSMRVGNRFSEATQAAKEFVSSIRDQDRVSIIGFDSRSTTYLELSSDKILAQGAVDRIRVGDFTQYNQGLQAATQVFENDKEESRRVVIFLSDGKPDDDQNILQQSIEEILSEQACVYTIAYAEAVDQQAQQVLQDIASQSQAALNCGEYFRAQENSYDLQRIYDQIFDVTTESEILTVTSQINKEESVELDISVQSSFNQQSLSDLACFTPEIEVVILRDNQVVLEEVISAFTLPLSLPEGDYEYIVRAIETCGGECIYTGSDEGSFTISSTDSACAVSAQELASLVSGTQTGIIEITGEGFSPRTVGTDGVVTWKNTDTVPHQVVGLQGEFQSPVLAPGEEWSYAFAPGEYAFVDTQGVLTGNVRSEYSEDVQASDVILVLDRSGSMAGQPLDNAKSAANTLLSILRPTDRASLIVFSDTADTIQSLTSDISQLQNAVNSVRSQGATRYLPPITQVERQLENIGTNRQQLVVFLSDGAPAETDEQVLNALEEAIGDACLYTIGYGEEGTQATNLLSSMAQYTQKENGCGAFYYSQAQQDELTQVFGEIYALSTRQQLVFENLNIDTTKNTVNISTTIRTETGRSLPYTQGNLCLPKATAQITVNDRQIPLRFDGQQYVASFDLEPGTYQADITARIIPQDRPEQTVIGSQRISINIRSWTRYVLIGFVILIALILAIKLFRRKQPPTQYVN